MKNWIPKKRFIVFVSTVMAFSIILYFSGLAIVLFQIKKIGNYYNNTESQSQREERVRAIKSATETNKDHIQILRDFFIKKGDEVKFIEQIEEIGRKSSIQFEISDIEVKANQIKNFKEDVTIRMNVEGSWLNLIQFIGMLEKMNFGISVQNLSLDAKNTAGWSGFIEFVVFREK